MLGYSNQTDIENRIGNTIGKQNIGREQINNPKHPHRTAKTSTSSYQNINIDLQPLTSHCIITEANIPPPGLEPGLLG